MNAIKLFWRLTRHKHKWRYRCLSPDAGRVFYCTRCGMVSGSTSGFIGHE